MCFKFQPEVSVPPTLRRPTLPCAHPRAALGGRRDSKSQKLSSHYKLGSVLGKGQSGTAHCATCSVVFTPFFASPSPSDTLIRGLVGAPLSSPTSQNRFRAEHWSLLLRDRHQLHTRCATSPLTRYGTVRTANLTPSAYKQTLSLSGSTHPSTNSMSQRALALTDTSSVSRYREQRYFGC